MLIPLPRSAEEKSSASCGKTPKNGENGQMAPSHASQPGRGTGSHLQSLPTTTLVLPAWGCAS